MKDIFSGTQMNKISKKVKFYVIKHAALKNNRAYLLRTEINKSHLNSRICQYCGVKTSTVTPPFYYVFNISLSCNNSIPSFMGNLWRVLLPGNHLKLVYHYVFKIVRVEVKGSFALSHRLFVTDVKCW